MTKKLCLVFAIAIVGLAPFTLYNSLWQQSDNWNTLTKSQHKPNSSSILRFATDDFFAGAFVDLKVLANNSKYQAFPMDALVPSSISFDRFNDCSVDQVAVFFGTGQPPTNQNSTEHLEIATVAKLSQPLDWPTFLSTWHQSSFPWEKQRLPEFETISIEGRSVFRLPTGTFLNTGGLKGKLQFTDREGNPAEAGISVGDFHSRSYIAGDSKAQAIFVIENLSESSLLDGFLQLRLAMDVFRTRKLDDEFCKASISVRRTDGALSSEPIEFDAKSFLDHSFKFPRQLNVLTTSGETKQVDLIDDLIADGTLEIVLSCDTESAYLGFVKDDLRVELGDYEYAFLDGSELLIAQSISTLNRMIKDAEKTSSLSKQLSDTGGNFTIFVDASDNKKLSAWQEALGLFKCEPLIRYFSGEIFKLQGSLSVQDDWIADLKLMPLGKTKAKHIKSKLTTDLDKAKNEAIHQSIEYSRRLSVIQQLTGFAIPGIFERMDDAEREKLEKHLSTLISDCHNSIRMQVVRNALAIRLQLPDSLVQPTHMDNVGMAILLLQRISLLNRDKQFVLGDKIHSNVTHRVPNSLSNWCFRAHQLSYNISAEFDGYDRKYYWVRRGVEVLLESIRKNPDAMELQWIASRFVAWKIGLSDSSEELRKRFAKDFELHESLSDFADLGELKQIDRNLDSWLVAKSMFDKTISDVEQSGKPISISPILFYSRPAICQLEYARSLDSRGQIALAGEQWKQAEALLQEFRQRKLQYKESQPQSLEDWAKQNDEQTDNQESDYQPDSDSIGSALSVYEEPLSVQFQVYSELYQQLLWKAKIEQLDKSRQIRQIEFVARKARKDGQDKVALSEFESAIEKIHVLTNSLPDSFTLNESESASEIVVRVFSELIDEYQMLIEVSGDGVPDTHHEIIQLNHDLKAQDQEFFPFHF